MSTASQITKKTQVLIVGGGPAGMLLAHILHRSGIESIVLEKRSREYVLERVRGGGLEPGTAEILHTHGLGERMDRESRLYENIILSGTEPTPILLNLKKHTGKTMTLYGQRSITQDLYHARDAIFGETLHNVSDDILHDLNSEHPYATFTIDGQKYRIDCDYIAGCDGSHGICSQSIPASKVQVYNKSYPLSWLGIVANAPPFPEIILGYHKRGFALLANRGPTLSRSFIQCSIDDTIEDWPDDRFWSELKARFPKEIADQIIPGKTSEKSIAPLRSYVIEPMQYGRLFLAGDAAHIVPPSAAKGLNLAFSDIRILSEGFIQAYKANTTRYLESYSETALKRVWGAERFSWWMTDLMHSLPNETPYELRIRESKFRSLATSEYAQAYFAEQWLGLGY